MADAHAPVALIVGAASPLGELAAECVGEAGFIVGLCDLSSEACARIQKKLAAQSSLAEAHPADPSKKLGFQTMLEHFLESHQRIDLLINAGVAAPRSTVLTMDEWDWRRAMDLNLSAPFISTQSVGRVFRELGGGMILNLVDESVDSFAYQSAAAAILAFSQQAHTELEPLGIQVAGLALTPEKQIVQDQLTPYLDMVIS